jgi:alpha-galactosidase
LTVFNWTRASRSHRLRLADLGLNPEHKFAAFDVLNRSAAVALEDGAVRIEKQFPESVRVLKLIDENELASAPRVEAQVPSVAKAGETIRLSAQTEAGGVPAVEYRWDFGDGVTATGSTVSHTYTQRANFVIRLTVEGIDGLSAVHSFSVKVRGNLRAFPNLIDNRRFQEATDR